MPTFPYNMSQNLIGYGVFIHYPRLRPVKTLSKLYLKIILGPAFLPLCGSCRPL